jgi:hypothetical protein
VAGLANGVAQIITSIEAAIGGIAGEIADRLAGVDPSGKALSYTASAATTVASNPAAAIAADESVAPSPPAPAPPPPSTTTSTAPSVPSGSAGSASPINVFAVQSALGVLAARVQGLSAILSAQASATPSANVESQIAALQAAVSGQSYNAAVSPPLGGGSSNTIAAAGAIDQLSGTVITTPSIVGGSISGASVSATGLSSSGDASIGGNLAVTGSLSGALIGANSLSVSSNSALSGNVSLGNISSTVVNDGQYNAFPGLTLLPNGDLIIVYRKGTTHTSTNGVIYYRTSADQGQTWSSETAVYSSPIADARDPEIVPLSSGKLLLSFFTTNATSSVTNVHTMLGTPTGDSVSWGSANLGSSLKGVGNAVFWVGMGSDRLGSSLS